MPQIGYDPTTGRLTMDGEVLDRNDPRLYGSIGRNVTDQSTVDQGSYGANIASQFPPEFYEPYTEYDGDNGEVTRYRLRPEIAEQLGGRIQLGQSGVGGFGEAVDPSKLQWDDQFGITSDPSNIKAPDEGTFWDKYGIYMMMAPAAYGALAGAGGGGAGAFEGAVGEGAVSGGGAFGSPGFGAGEWASMIPGAPEAPAAFGTPGFGAGESFFGADTLGLGGGGGTLGTGTSLVGTGLGPGTLTGELGSGFSLAGTGLAPGAVTGTGAVAGGAAGGSMLRDAVSLARDLLGGGEQGQGGQILGGFGAAPKIGDHRQDNDPYGLMASGLGPWSGIIPEAKDRKTKIAEALMKQPKYGIGG